MPHLDEVKKRKYANFLNEMVSNGSTVDKEKMETFLSAFPLADQTEEELEELGYIIVRGYANDLRYSVSVKGVAFLNVNRGLIGQAEKEDPAPTEDRPGQGISWPSEESSNIPCKVQGCTFVAKNRTGMTIHMGKYHHMQKEAKPQKAELPEQTVKQMEALDPLRIRGDVPAFFGRLADRIREEARANNLVIVSMGTGQEGAWKNTEWVFGVILKKDPGMPL